MPSFFSSFCSLSTATLLYSNTGDNLSNVSPLKLKKIIWLINEGNAVMHHVNFTSIISLANTLELTMEMQNVKPFCTKKIMLVGKPLIPHCLPGVQETSGQIGLNIVEAMGKTLLISCLGTHRN